MLKVDLRGHSSAGRALAWHARGRRFDPAWLHASPSASRGAAARNRRRSVSGEARRAKTDWHILLRAARPCDAEGEASPAKPEARRWAGMLASVYIALIALLNFDGDAFGCPRAIMWYVYIIRSIRIWSGIARFRIN